ncbi:MFS transporter [Plantactinospora sp. GCM10030261]|uniref:MFS transporter n=1 Tax=Plantactinospora sp. GCM10030261 TaxID=3273420 RepID=UPI00360D284A
MCLLLINVASFLLLAATGLLLRTRRGGTRRPADGPGQAGPSRGAMLAGVGADGAADVDRWRMRRDHLLRTVVLAIAAVVAAVGAINVVQIFFVRETLGASATMYGFVTASWMAGSLVGVWTLGQLARRWSDDGVLALAALIMLGGCSLMVLATAAVPAAVLIVPLSLAGGACNGGVNVMTIVLTTRRAPEPVRGRAFAMLNASGQGAAMIGYLLGGVLLAVLAPRPSVALCGAAGLVVAAAGVLPVRRAARRSSVETDAGLATFPAAR